METQSLIAAVRAELLAHPEVTEGPHRFGGIVFHLGDRELGHLHGETVADLPFPPHIRDELVASGRVSSHHVVSDSPWVSRRVNRPDDIADIVELFRMSYGHAASLCARGDDRDDDQAAAPSMPRQRTATWRHVLALPLRPLLRRRSRR
jgi:hypothetical protein